MVGFADESLDKEKAGWDILSGQRNGFQGLSGVKYEKLLKKALQVWKSDKTEYYLRLRTSVPIYC